MRKLASVLVCVFSKPALVLYLLPAVVLLGYAPAQTPAPAASQQENRSQAVRLPAPKSQEQCIVYWTTEVGWNTELLLRNNLEGSDLTVTPSLRAADGSETALPAVAIAPGDVTTVDLRETLSQTAPSLVGAWGSLVLRYHSRVNGALYASVMVRADGRPIAFHLDGFGRGSTYETGSREGIWWLPRPEITDYLILTNSGERLLEPRLVLYEANGKTWQQSVKLLAHQSQRLSIRGLLRQSGLQGSYGGFKIDIAQGARFLDSAHVLFEQSGGFSAVMKMFRHDPRTTLASRAFANVKEWTTRAPMLALSTPDPALGLPAGTALQPMLFVRNSLVKTVTAHIRFNWRSRTSSGKSAPIDLILKANETKVLNVGTLQDGKTLPPDADWASVILSAPVLPDELLAVAASYDQTGRYGAQTPFSDQLAPHWEGGKWEVDGAHNSLSTIINGGNKPVVAELTIFYNQGKGQYQMQRLLAPEEQMFVDFGQLIHYQIPDKNGQILPHDLTFGAYRVRDLTDSTTASLYEGKVIVDKTFGHVSYGCMICCGPDSPFMMYDPLPVSVGGSARQGVQAMDSCTERISTITGDFSTWWTDDTSIATASGSSIGGVAAGTTNNNAQSVMMYFGPKEDSGGGPCPQDQEDTSASTNVGVPDHLIVVVDQQGASAMCPSTGVQLRQMQMRVVDVGGNTVPNSPSVVESLNPAQPANSCGNGSPIPASCAPTAADSTFIDSMGVSGNLCNSGISRSSGCGFTATSTWNACATSGINTLWVSPRVVKSNLVTVDSNSTSFIPGAICNSTGCH
jgi:hypothetical protein